MMYACVQSVHERAAAYWRGCGRRFCEPTRRRAGRLAAWPVIILACVSLRRRAFEGERERVEAETATLAYFLDLLDELDPVELVVAAGVLVDDALHVERRREAGRLDAVGRVPDRDEAGELRCRVLFIRGREAARDGGEDEHTHTHKGERRRPVREGAFNECRAEGEGGGRIEGASQPSSSPFYYFACAPARRCGRRSRGAWRTSR